MTPIQIYNQIKDITKDLIEVSLCCDQNFPNIKKLAGNLVDISINNDEAFSLYKNILYSEMYEILNEKRMYNIKMFDGALIQLQYKFLKRSIIYHRLVYFPSPSICEYQDEFIQYDEDNINYDIHDKRIVTVPIRFDYNKNCDASIITHPVCHLTLGQYENCRIPVKAALTPCCFIDFILCSFYNTAKRNYCDKITISHDMFSQNITSDDLKKIYLSVPCKS